MNLTPAETILYLALSPRELGQIRVDLWCRLEAIVDGDATEVRLRFAQAMEVLARLAWLIGHVMHVGRFE